MIIDLKNADEVKDLLKVIAKHKKDLPKEVVSAAKAISGNKSPKSLDAAKMRVEHRRMGEVSLTKVLIK